MKDAEPKPTLGSAFLLLATIVLLSPPARSVTADSPLTVLERFSGRVGVAIDVVPQENPRDLVGVFSIDGIPASASVLAAWFVTTSFASAVEGATVAFAGVDHGVRPPEATDPSKVLILKHYRFDVTDSVASPGNGTYGYSVSGTTNVWGDALIVVFEDETLPRSELVIQEGSESLEFATSTTTFREMPSGQGRLLLFTQSDDARKGGTERLGFNGGTLLGPGEVYFGNQGPFASLFDHPVTVVEGDNTVSVTTEDDWFGLHLAVLQAPLDLPVEVDIRPETYPNPVQPVSRGVLPVAVLGSDAFDVETIDRATLAFGPAAAVPAHGAGGHLVDVNEDGFIDLLSHYRTRDSGIAFGDGVACVRGETHEGASFEGCDSIVTVGACGLGFELALLLPPLLAHRLSRERRREYPSDAGETSLQVD